MGDKTAQLERFVRRFQQALVSTEMPISRALTLTILTQILLQDRVTLIDFSLHRAIVKDQFDNHLIN
jgi:hypothetical protein